MCTCRAYATGDYPAVCGQAAAIMHMIMNNLDHSVAQFPQELVTYGGNGQVFSNWAQVRTAVSHLTVLYTQGLLSSLNLGAKWGAFPFHPLSLSLPFLSCPLLDLT